MFRTTSLSSPSARPGRRCAARAVLAAAVATAAVGGLAACGDDDEIDDVDVDVTTDATDIGGVPGTDTGSSSDITTGGSTGDSTVPTPVSGSVADDDMGNGGTTAP